LHGSKRKLKNSESKTTQTTRSTEESRPGGETPGGLPYLGPNGAHQPNSSARWYGSDHEQRALEIKANKDLKNIELINAAACGDWSYHFNSLGFRGPEFQMSAAKKIVVAGDSSTFGEGVPWEYTWGVQFVERLRQYEQTESISLLDIAQSGASNDYIARAALAQAAAARPDILAVIYTSTTRKEHVDSSAIHHLGPWCEGDLAERYYHYYSEEDGLINSLKNMLLLQYYCESHSIEYYYAWTQQSYLRKKGPADNPIVVSLMSRLRRDCLCNSRIFSYDHGRDCVHPGPEGHATQADQFFACYESHRN